MSRASSPSAAGRYARPASPGVGGSPLDGLRAAGSGQPHRATCGEARTEAGMDGRGADRADSLLAGSPFIGELPQGLGAAAPGASRSDAGGGPARPDPGRAPPRAAQPRRHDRNWGTDATACLTTREGNESLTGVRPSTRRAPARASRRWSRCAGAAGTLRRQRPGLALRHDHGSQYMSDPSRASCAFLGIRSARRSWPRPRATAAPSFKLGDGPAAPRAAPSSATATTSSRRAPERPR